MQTTRLTPATVTAHVPLASLMALTVQSACPV